MTRSAVILTLLAAACLVQANGSEPTAAELLQGAAFQGRWVACRNTPSVYGALAGPPGGG